MLCGAGEKVKSPAASRGTADQLLHDLVDLERKQGHSGDPDYDVFEFRFQRDGAAQVSSRGVPACRLVEELEVCGRDLTAVFSGSLQVERARFDGNLMVVDLRK